MAGRRPFINGFWSLWKCVVLSHVQGNLELANIILRVRLSLVHTVHSHSLIPNLLWLKFSLVQPDLIPRLAGFTFPGRWGNGDLRFEQEWAGYESDGAYRYMAVQGSLIRKDCNFLLAATPCRARWQLGYLAKVINTYPQSRRKIHCATIPTIFTHFLIIIHCA